MTNISKEKPPMVKQGIGKRAMPPQNTVTSEVILTIIEGINNKDKAEAKALFEQALTFLYEDCNLEITPLLELSIDGAFALVLAINPQNDFEKIYVAQIVLGHILGTQKLSQPNQQDQNIALKLLETANVGMQNIYKMRCDNQSFVSK